MANMEHVQIVRQGRDAVARWREEHPNEYLDLNASYMSYAKLNQVDISGSDIRDSDFMGASLRRANLSGCHLNPCHLYRADMRQANLSRALLNGANMRGANLAEADLSNADLDRVILSGANLSGANLSGANLSRVNLTDANLTGADLTGAVANRAALTRANLTDAILRETDFYEATFANAVLTGAKFGGCIIGYTVFQNCDMGSAEGLDQVRHDAPSTVGIDTLYRSGGAIDDAFLRGTGVPEGINQFQSTLAHQPQVLGSCFISCTTEDLAFAQGLLADLQAQGVPCWLFSEETRGNSLVNRHSTSDQEEVERWVRDYDKLVVVCSALALDRETVLNDIIHAQEKQREKDQWVLYLVASDNALVQPRARQARSLSAEHVVFDLRERESASAAYQQEVVRLSENLKQVQEAKAGVPVYDNQL